MGSGLGPDRVAFMTLRTGLGSVAGHATDNLARDMALIT